MANEEAKKKLEQLQQAVNVLEKVIDNCSWASDMTDYGVITGEMDSVCEAAETSREQLQEWIDDLEAKLEEFKEKEMEFLVDNEIKV